MNWKSLGDFLAMGGAGFFVWMSYGVCALVAIAEIGTLRQRRRRARAAAAREQR
jgi:heme exporter protein D